MHRATYLRASISEHDHAPRASGLITVMLLAFALLLPHAHAEDEKKPAKYDPLSAYEDRPLEGWTIRINSAFPKREPELAAQTLELLQHQLYQIKRRVPAAALKQLQRVVIWVEEAEPHHPCMVYHPDPKWLAEHDMHPAKAKGVELANARNFLSWTIAQPWMVLHELAHAYHDQFLPKGFENPEVAEAFQAAQKAGLYDSVLHINTQKQKAYACTNPMEYFAEASEAFFGTNDFYPFVRSELARHDPALFDVLKKAWGESEK